MILSLRSMNSREEDGRVDRTFVFVLDVGVVRQRVVRFDATPAVDHFALVGHGLGKRGLSRSRSADQNDVLDLLG